MHWFTWDELGKPKCGGRLGFRRLEQFNQVLLAKQVRRLIEQPNSLVARIFKAHYHRHTSLVDVGIGSGRHISGGHSSGRGT